MMGLFKKRVRFIPQLEMVECGAASLAMVLDYHGCSVPLVETRTACAVSRDGVNASRILRAARDFGLVARGLRLEPGDLGRLPMPAILHWEFNHFVVLEKKTRRGAVLVDPARGRRYVSEHTLGASYTGVVLAFEPAATLPQRPHHSRSLARYFGVLFAERKALGYVALSALLLQLIGLLFATSTQVLIDHVVKAQRTSWLAPIALVLALGLVFRHLLSFLRDRVLIGLQTAIDLTLLGDFVDHMMQLPMGFFAQRSTGDLMQRVEENGELRSITAALALSALDALMLVVYAGMMLAYDLRLGALTLAVSFSRMLIAWRAGLRLRQISEQQLSLSGREAAAMVEALAAPEMMRALGAEGELFARFTRRMGERLNAALEVKRASGALNACMLAFDGAATALVLYLGGNEVIAGRMTVGVFAGFLILQRLVDAPLAALIGCFDRYALGQAILARVDDVLDTATEPTGTRALPALRGEILFENVSFRHGPSSPWLFRDLTLRIAPGEKIALVGRSGQGKTTLMKLLLGVVSPEEGRILLDGVPLVELDRQALAAQIGVVLQEPALIADTVAENLRLRIPDASQDELAEAARIACVDELIAQLPRGYRTKLGQGERALSGGQRQRLSLARAVVRRPKLLLLDEATSALDLPTETAVHANLAALGCTRVLIAHRLATVRDADRILVIDGGAIVQEGRFDALARVPGPFRALVEGQLP
jgi:ATP-binding cassette, subfamily B, bacterial